MTSSITTVNYFNKFILEEKGDGHLAEEGNPEDGGFQENP